jgi:hypothetical protein
MKRYFLLVVIAILAISPIMARAIEKDRTEGVESISDTILKKYEERELNEGEINDLYSKLEEALKVYFNQVDEDAKNEANQKIEEMISILGLSKEVWNEAKKNLEQAIKNEAQSKDIVTGNQKKLDTAKKDSPKEIAKKKTDARNYAKKIISGLKKNNNVTKKTEPVYFGTEEKKENKLTINVGFVVSGDSSKFESVSGFDYRVSCKGLNLKPTIRLSMDDFSLEIKCILQREEHVIRYMGAPVGEQYTQSDVEIALRYSFTLGFINPYIGLMVKNQRIKGKFSFGATAIDTIYDEVVHGILLGIDKEINNSGISFNLGASITPKAGYSNKMPEGIVTFGNTEESRVIQISAGISAEIL